ncbi:MAG: ribonuclease E/G [Alphaproteobacteria bacterium]|nr:ribonuclease E/G [Alphaproteobacteria bacterium]
MAARRALYLDEAPGEARGVVTLGGRPERLLIVRGGEVGVQSLGAGVAARVRKLDRRAGIAFLDLGEGPDAALNLKGVETPLVEGASVEVEIRAEARADKGPTARWIGPCEGRPRLLRPPPALDQRLAAFAPDARIVAGPAAREAADLAEAEALEIVHPLPGGGTISVEPTRALTAIDVDLGERSGSAPKQVARAANLAALAEAARVLRLKGLGGLVAIDLVGQGHDANALLAAARTAFAPDNPGVALAGISRFGVLEIALPRRARPVLERLARPDGTPSDETLGLRLVRELEREALADPGGRFAGLATPQILAFAEAPVAWLNARMGGRLALRSAPPSAGAPYAVVRA